MAISYRSIVQIKSDEIKSQVNFLRKTMFHRCNTPGRRRITPGVTRRPGRLIYMRAVVSNVEWRVTFFAMVQTRVMGAVADAARPGAGATCGAGGAGAPSRASKRRERHSSTLMGFQHFFLAHDERLLHLFKASAFGLRSVHDRLRRETELAPRVGLSGEDVAAGVNYVVNSEKRAGLLTRRRRLRAGNSNPARAGPG